KCHGCTGCESGLVACDKRGALAVLVLHASDRRDGDNAGGRVERRLDRLDEGVGRSHLLDDQGRLRTDESARCAGLHQVLVLVVVDVEVVEHGDLATAVGSDVVVCQVDNDANQVGDLLQRLNGDNLVDPQCKIGRAHV